MCTVSILRNKNGLIVTSNRDELRTRDEAGIRQELTGATHRIYPVDAQAKGTWVGVNDFGVVSSLLNMYESDYKGDTSRGLIIPRLLEFQSLVEAREWLTSSFQPRQYSAFVLLLMDKEDLYRYRWDGLSMDEELIEFSNYFLESSSSVNLSDTIAHRQCLFKAWQLKSDINNSANEMLTFHCARDEGNATKSICMARELSHTKSVSQIQIDDSDVDFRYLSPQKLAEKVNTYVKVEDLENIKSDLLAPSDTDELLAKICAM
ncbi:MAG: NRDE family protein [Thiotrichales bacterium]|nr:NRDE family protein [Thiotrichales bacterium]